MVFTGISMLVRARGPDEFWRKRNIFKLAAHFIGRRRNCFSIALRNVHRSLAYATKARKLKKEDNAKLWDTRITAACMEHNFTGELALEDYLRDEKILLNRKILSELACWEPRTFAGLIEIVKPKK